METMLDALTQAERLAERVVRGTPLSELASPIPLGSGEVLHAQVEADGWRFHGLDVLVEQRQHLVLGGPVAFGLAATAAAIGNRRARSDAERLAAPQWRPLGVMPVLATNQRLVVFHVGVWGSVWYSAIRQLIPRPTEGRLELLFEDDPPYLLVGEWVPYLTVVVTAVLAQVHGVDTVTTMLCTA